MPLALPEIAGLDAFIPPQPEDVSQALAVIGANSPDDMPAPEMYSSSYSGDTSISADVERWRPLVSKYFKPQDVDKALYVIQHESGGNPSIMNREGSGATGLFQIMPMHGINGADPEASVRWAAQQVADHGWTDWGEGTSYQGKNYGTLGQANPYGPGGNAKGDPGMAWNMPDRSNDFGMNANMPDRSNDRGMSINGDASMLAPSFNDTLSAVRGPTLPNPNDVQAATNQSFDMAKNALMGASGSHVGADLGAMTGQIAGAVDKQRTDLQSDPAFQKLPSWAQSDILAGKQASPFSLRGSPLAPIAAAYNYLNPDLPYGVGPAVRKYVQPAAGVAIDAAMPFLSTIKSVTGFDPGRAAADVGIPSHALDTALAIAPFIGEAGKVGEGVDALLHSEPAQRGAMSLAGKALESDSGLFGRVGRGALDLTGAPAPIRGAAEESVGTVAPALTGGDPDVAAAVRAAREGIQTDAQPSSIKNLLGQEDVKPGLNPVDRAVNALKETANIGTPEEAQVTPIMRERGRVKQIAESQSNRTGAVVSRAIDDNFALDKTGRITDLPGKPTIPDLAARLPEYEAVLTDGQRDALNILKGEVEKYSQVFKGQGLEVGTRADVQPGGFYLPRGRADIEGADAPIAQAGRRRGGRGGFEKTATFDSMAQGIDAGYKYSDPATAIQSYAKDASRRAIDEHTANTFRNLTDDEGRPLMSSAADRVNPQLRDQVQSLRAQIHGRLDTLVRQETRGSAEGVAQSRLEGLLKDTEDRVQRTFDRLDVAEAKGRTTSYMGAVARGPTDIAIAKAKAEMQTLDQAANRVAGATQQAAERGSRTRTAYSATESDIQSMRQQLDSLNTEWAQNKKIAAQTPRGMGSIDLPGLQGQSFPEAMSAAANKYLAAERPISGSGDNLLNVPKAVNSLLRGLRATADVSFMGIQGLLGLAQDPAAYAGALKTAMHSMVDENALGSFLRDFDKAAIAEGKPTSEQWIANGLHLGGRESEFNIGGGLPGALKKIQDAPILAQANRSFGNFGDSLRLGLADTVVSRGKDLRETADAANLLTGWSRGRFLGNAGDFLEFAPRYLQSQLETLTKAATDTGVAGQEARGALVKMMGFGTLTTIGANEALGNKGFDYLTPTTKRGDLNPNFMRIRAMGQDWSLFGPWDSLLRAAMAGSKGDLTYLARTKASPIVSEAWDLISGKTFTGEDSRTPQALLQNFVPFSLGKATSQPAGVTALGATGLKSSPETPNEQRDAAAFAATGKHYADLTPEARKQFDEGAGAKLNADRPASPYQKDKEAAEANSDSVKESKQTTANFAKQPPSRDLRDIWHDEGVARKTISDQLATEYAKQFSTFDKTKFDAAVKGYFDATVRDSNGTIDPEATDAAQQDYLKKLKAEHPDQYQWVDETLQVSREKLAERDPLHAEYLDYLDKKEAKGYFAKDITPSQRTELDKANPDLDVQAWKFGATKDKPGPALNSVDAADQALALKLPGRPVKFSGLARDLAESPKITEAWDNYKKPLSLYFDDDAVLAGGRGQRVASRLAANSGDAAYRKPFEQMDARHQSTVLSETRQQLLEDHADLDAAMLYFGHAKDGIAHSKAAYNRVSELADQYGRTRAGEGYTVRLMKGAK